MLVADCAVEDIPHIAGVYNAEDEKIDEQRKQIRLSAEDLLQYIEVMKPSLHHNIQRAYDLLKRDVEVTKLEMDSSDSGE